MAVPARYEADAKAILAHRHDNGWDYWTTQDRRLFKGSPFSALEAPQFLMELGAAPGEGTLQQVAELFWGVWQPDGRFKVYPSGGIYPCQTALAAGLLCRMGYASDARMQKTFAHFMESRYTDGGWRCNKFSYGRGPETEYSTPLTTLAALDAMRYDERMLNDAALDDAVDFLLLHWELKKPIGPCQYGIGTLFMQVEYPFRGYNLFWYVYVLSFYKRAVQDGRFLQAFAALQDRMQEGQIVVQRVVPKLAKLAFCQKGQPSELATARYREIARNVGAG